jgi:CO/xanthine dehydrogenase Mo-binding subunit
MADLKPPAWRNDAVAKVTGKTKFTDDLKFVSMLHAVPVYADHVHARLIEVDTGKAGCAEGVVRILTARDVPGSNRHGQIVKDFRIFADDRIRYNGDVVAVVVAETRRQAIQAAELVRIEAEPLPAVLDAEEAMKDGAVLVHEELGTNIVNIHRVRRGDADQALNESDLVIEEVFETQTVEHVHGARGRRLLCAS